MEEGTKTLLCGDLFTQGGAALPALTESDILGPSEAFRHVMDYFSHTKNARAMLERLASTGRQRLRVCTAVHGVVTVRNYCVLLLMSWLRNPRRLAPPPARSVRTPPKRVAGASLSRSVAAPGMRVHRAWALSGHADRAIQLSWPPTRTTPGNDRAGGRCENPLQDSSAYRSCPARPCGQRRSPAGRSTDERRGCNMTLFDPHSYRRRAYHSGSVPALRAKLSQRPSSFSLHFLSLQHLRLYRSETPLQRLATRRLHSDATQSCDW